MICGACAAAGRHNAAGNGFDASILHDMCVNYMLYDDCPQKNWCDCGHVVTVEFEEPYGCRNCDGRKCMECVCRIWHEECQQDCPDCCVPEWEKELALREV